MYYSDHYRKNMIMSKKNLKLSTTNYLNMNEDCAKLETKVQGRKLSRTFQEWNNPSFG